MRWGDFDVLLWVLILKAVYYVSLLPNSGASHCEISQFELRTKKISAKGLRFKVERGGFGYGFVALLPACGRSRGGSASNCFRRRRRRLRRLFRPHQTVVSTIAECGMICTLLSDWKYPSFCAEKVVHVDFVCLFKPHCHILAYAFCLNFCSESRFWSVLCICSFLEPTFF